MKFSTGFFIVLGGAIVVLSLFVINIVLAARQGHPSRRVTLALHGAAVVVVLFNFFRSLETGTNYVLAAHVVVLFSVGVSLKRYLEAAKEPGGGEVSKKEDALPR